jgi:hypothetical protein
VAFSLGNREQTFGDPGWVSELAANAGFPPDRSGITEIAGAKNGIFFEFSLCLSRACLGKMIVLIYKWLKNAVFRRAYGSILHHDVSLSW